MSWTKTPALIVEALTEADYTKACHATAERHLIKQTHNVTKDWCRNSSCHFATYQS